MAKRSTAHGPEVQMLGLVAPLLTAILTVVVYSWAPCLNYGIVARR